MRRTYRFVASSVLVMVLILVSSTAVDAEILSPKSGAIRVVGAQPAPDGLTKNAATPRFVAAEQAVYIPSAAHLSGAVGTNWRTDLELYNPGVTQCDFSIELLARDRNNASPASTSFQLGPGLAARYPDVLASVFSFTGSAALRVTPSSCILQVSSRTFNNTPSGTYGQLVPGRPVVTAVPADVPVRLIQLSESGTSGSGFRTNIGFVNATSNSMRLTIDLYDASGTLLGTVPSHLTTLRPLEYRQVDRVFRSVTSTAISDGYAVLSTDTPDGAFFAFASVVDNRTGDPIFMSELQPVNALTVTKQFEETTYFLRDVEMLSSTTGWAVGESHWDRQAKRYVTTLLKTTDGGTTWSEKTTGETGGLNAIDFHGGNTAWAVGGLGDVIHTADGGQTWEKQDHDASYSHMMQVSFIDERTGWIAAEGGFLSTNDGGRNWTIRELGVGGDLHDLAFPSAAVGWAVGDYGNILHTSDGGATWSAVDSGTRLSLLGLHCVRADLCWAVGSYGEILRIGRSTSQPCSPTGSVRFHSRQGPHSSFTTSGRSHGR